MKPSFRQFMSDHDRIEAVAASLLADVDRPSTPAARIHQTLRELATVVEDHVVAENQVIGELESKSISGPWQTTWSEGKASFDKLKADWVSFLSRWSEDRIVENFGLFSFECRAILGRISERLRQETQAFYATALQFDTISLR